MPIDDPGPIDCPCKSGGNAGDGSKIQASQPSQPSQINQSAVPGYTSVPPGAGAASAEEVREVSGVSDVPEAFLPELPRAPGDDPVEDLDDVVAFVGLVKGQVVEQLGAVERIMKDVVEMLRQERAGERRRARRRERAVAGMGVYAKKLSAKETDADSVRVKVLEE